jgi:NAD(P)-dependent dehydrogenase (short-subunit alcohol dehydrogenase family)
LIDRPDTIVFAGSRDPSNKDLQALATANPDRFCSIALDSADEPLNKAAADFIEEKAGKLDVVIANAGMLHLLHTRCLVITL